MIIPDNVCINCFGSFLSENDNAEIYELRGPLIYFTAPRIFPDILNAFCYLCLDCAANRKNILDKYGIVKIMEQSKVFHQKIIDRIDCIIKTCDEVEKNRINQS